MIRSPIAAGRFYPAQPEQLHYLIKTLAPKTAPPPTQQALALILPHAGYQYSGATALETLANAELPERFLLLGPNHRGVGAACALSMDDWRIPDAIVPTDAPLAQMLAANSSLIQADSAAHQGEHSIEVLLPLMAHFKPSARIAALALAALSFAQCQALARDLAQTLRRYEHPVLVIASTDMNHFESRALSRPKDQLALQRILALDAEGLYRCVVNERISMCGVIPVTVAVLLAVEMGAKQARLIRYTDSGEVSGDLEQVVGYAGMTLSK